MRILLYKYSYKADKGYLFSIPAYKKSQLCTTCLNKMKFLLWLLVLKESDPSWKYKRSQIFSFEDIVNDLYCG